MKEHIIYEDDFMLAINKPAGLQVEWDKWGYASAEAEVEKYLSEKTPKAYVGVVHRIDRPVSGVLIFAKKKFILVRLNEQFAQKEVKKMYYGIVSTKPETEKDTLTQWIKRDETNKTAIVTAKKTNGSFYCELKYKLVQEQGENYLLEIEPITGKFHQIRAQLAFINCPVIGDEKYGSAIKYKENGICLHARSMEFTHPYTKEPMKIMAEFPEDKVWGLFHVQEGE